MLRLAFASGIGQKLSGDAAMDNREIQYQEEKINAFHSWKAEADDACEDLCGMSLNDLPDIDYWALFAASISPRDAARQAISEAGGDDLLEASDELDSLEE
jgi:hypothetical protein